VSLSEEVCSLDEWLHQPTPRLLVGRGQPARARAMRPPQPRVDSAFLSRSAARLPWVDCSTAARIRPAAVVRRFAAPRTFWEVSLGARRSVSWRGRRARPVWDGAQLSTAAGTNPLSPAREALTPKLRAGRIAAGQQWMEDFLDFTEERAARNAHSFVPIWDARLPVWMGWLRTELSLSEEEARAVIAKVPPLQYWLFTLDDSNNPGVNVSHREGRSQNFLLLGNPTSLADSAVAWMGSKEGPNWNRAEIESVAVRVNTQQQSSYVLYGDYCRVLLHRCVRPRSWQKGRRSCRWVLN
jgi:hypothetical protein